MYVDKIIIQRMTPDNIPAVSKLNCSCYRWLGKKNGFTAEQIEFLVSVRGSIETIASESHSQIYLIACINDTIVGIAAVKDNEVAKLFVDPECHSLGIGEKLFNVAQKIIVENGYNEMIAGVIAQSAIGFYEKMGMFKYGEKELNTGAFKGCKVPLMRKTLINARPGMEQ